MSPPGLQSRIENRRSRRLNGECIATVLSSSCRASGGQSDELRVAAVHDNRFDPARKSRLRNRTRQRRQPKTWTRAPGIFPIAFVKATHLPQLRQFLSSASAANMPSKLPKRPELQNRDRSKGFAVQTFLKNQDPQHRRTLDRSRENPTPRPWNDRLFTAAPHGYRQLGQHPMPMPAIRGVRKIAASHATFFSAFVVVAARRAGNNRPDGRSPCPPPA